MSFQRGDFPDRISIANPRYMLQVCQNGSLRMARMVCILRLGSLTVHASDDPSVHV